MVTVGDFKEPFYGLKRQGSDADPKRVPLVVIAWQPRGKGEPPLSASQLRDLFFGSTQSVAQWFEENSQGRFRLVPHPSHPVIGPMQSVYPWPFYWRNDPQYVRKHLCGGADVFCDDWQQNPYKVPPPKDDPHHHADRDGKAWYLDDEGYIGGHRHSWAEAIRGAARQINFSDFDRNNDGSLSTDDCLVVIVKAQDSNFGTRRSVSGSDVPPTDLEVDGVTIDVVCEYYGSAPHDHDDVAVATEEVLHLAANLADQYPDRTQQYPHGNVRRDDDPRRPGQLALTDAGHNPVHIDPYHKLKWGWLDPQLADRSGTYTLRPVSTTGDALILYSPYFGTNEFFLLENRWRGESYDRFRHDRYGEGLALWHCIQDSELANNWARRAVHLKRPDPRLDSDGQIRVDRTLFDGSDPARSYDLHDDSYPQNLRFRNGRASRIRIRNISPAGPEMTVDVEVPPNKGEIGEAEGQIQMLRAHEHGTGYGPTAHRLDGDCIVTLDTEPGTAFGVALTGARAPAGREMFDVLRDAFQAREPVRIEYTATSAVGGSVIRVRKST